ncbi:MAG TPA: BtpA/SgcQ family protein [Candidatus Cloacimonadota bacterium]|nr:BtpA/SgcQ family protein [Candidatus Cloacimonadota bacterium]
MNKFSKPFFQTKKIIGMIHVPALPGTPKHEKSISEIIDIAVQEGKIYQECGIDAVMLENMHDVPYLNREVGPEIVATMTAIASEVKRNVNLPCGIQILAGANQAALAAAYAAGCEFVRAEGFVFSHIADEGLMNSDAGELMRFRSKIGADNIAVFTDIKKKHSSHTITGDLSISDFAKAAEFFLSDGIIITGKSTADAAELSDLDEARKATSLPIIIGSGITAENLRHYWQHADGFIVGSYFKQEGKWFYPVARERVIRFMNEKNKLRS